MILKYFVVSPFSESATSKCGVVDSCSLLQMNKAMQPRSALTARRAPGVHVQHQMLLLPTFSAAGRGQRFTKEGRVAS